MPDTIAHKRALISVSDKSGLKELAAELTQHNIELLSTGGTAAALRELGHNVIDVSNATGSPEILGGRVKTLHPKVHGAILADRSDPDHVAQMQEHGIEPIDLVVVNLYPFSETAAKEGATFEEIIEQIDIGGVALLRAAAKNFKHVCVVSDAPMLEELIVELRENKGETTREFRLEAACHAFSATTNYDDDISLELIKRARDTITDGDHPIHPLPSDSGIGEPGSTNGEHDEPFTIDARLIDAVQHELHITAIPRYGENPHQKAAVFANLDMDTASIPKADQYHGKELSYNNYLDASAATVAALELALIPDGSGNPQVGATVIKHSNPCGGAVSGNVRDAATLALAGDPLAAYGGILALSAPVDGETAERIIADAGFLEVVLAPSFDDEAIRTLGTKWANVRILAYGDNGLPPQGQRRALVRSILGGVLVQTPDEEEINPANWEHKAGPAPSADTLAAAATVWQLGKSLTSNAIAIGGFAPEADITGVRLFGAGAGQMDRVASCRIAIEKASKLVEGAIAASDAFFPFSDGPKLLIDAGVKTIVHPGGSKRDQDTFDLCNEHGVTCLTTGMRHFRH